jgi:hypothetical protein
MTAADGEMPVLPAHVESLLGEYVRGQSEALLLRARS